jgi:hypothetical protein
VRVWVGDRASNGRTLRVDDPPGLVGGDVAPEVILSPPPLAIISGAADDSDIPVDMLRWLVQVVMTTPPPPPPPLARLSCPGAMFP